ncbi:MAG: hypothetical protein Q8P95_05440 [bacterium]|nr:hypothetical protein [bacterium]
MAQKKQGGMMGHHMGKQKKGFGKMGHGKRGSFITPPKPEQQ